MRRESKDYASGTSGGALRRPRQQSSTARQRAAAEPRAAGASTGHRILDVGAVLDAAVQMAVPTAGRRGVHLAARVCGAMSVAVDPVLLFGAVEGLVSNAIARSSKGSVVVCAVRTIAGEAVISIADEGADFDNDDLARMLWPHVEVAPGAATAGEPRRLDGAWLGRMRNMVGARLAARSRGPGAGIVLALHIPLA